MRAWSRLRVILHSEHWQLAMPKSFYTMIVEIDMRHTERRGARNPNLGATHGEPVILGGDRHLARVDFLDGMVSAVVTVRQLIRLSAVR